MQTVKAAICHEFGKDLVIEDITLRAPGSREVEVTVEAVAICHSDISYADGAWGGPLPAVYGHEAAGRISAVGAEVSGLQVGDKVVVTLIRSCQSCTPCCSGQPTRCTERYDQTQGPISCADGTALAQGLDTGAFAQKLVVGAAQVVKLPEDIPSQVGCLLGCGVITGIGAVVNTARVRPGQNVVVIGAGGVGLNAIQGARLAGAAHITAVDMSEEKLDMAREFGATAAVLASDPTPWKAAYKAAGGGADAVFVTVGAIPAYDSAHRFLAPGGRIIAVGLPHSGEKAQYEPVVMGVLGQGIQASYMGDVVISRDIPWMVELYRQGRLKLDELISGCWSFEEINDAIADTRTGTARRNVIVF
ncbi:zinc-binding dehydrogenase [Aliiroseovarius crassostreae]|uniref:zinc-binding dehydrogenase n=1 Tax=Aliiroseovarius crassostreae TaxID=154981 RepID=UPI0021FE8BD1|nr:zinc-binding dehydrogenase [Aliiroseovarius crassostreae]UWP88429.1 alcohol dehydrogenase catalytic domain-containing protein [Aliiroseovarius crassostreae]